MTNSVKMTTHYVSAEDWNSAYKLQLETFRTAAKLAEQLLKEDSPSDSQKDTNDLRRSISDYKLLSDPDNLKSQHVAERSFFSWEDTLRDGNVPLNKKISKKAKATLEFSVEEARVFNSLIESIDERLEKKWSYDTSKNESCPNLAAEEVQ